MTYHRSQAHRTLRIPGWYIGLALMVASAVVVAGVVYLAFVLLTSLSSYVPTLP